VLLHDEPGEVEIVLDGDTNPEDWPRIGKGTDRAEGFRPLFLTEKDIGDYEELEGRRATGKEVAAGVLVGADPEKRLGRNSHFHHLIDPAPNAANHLPGLVHHFAALLCLPDRDQLSCTRRSTSVMRKSPQKIHSRQPSLR
jgi:hypothetical protein